MKSFHLVNKGEGGRMMRKYQLILCALSIGLVPMLVPSIGIYLINDTLSSNLVFILTIFIVTGFSLSLLYYHGFKEFIR